MRVSTSAPGGVGLLRTHVLDRTDDAPIWVYNVSCAPLRSGFGDPEVDNAWQGLAVDFADEDVRRLQVAMNDCLLMRMLHPSQTGMNNSNRCFVVNLCLSQ